MILIETGAAGLTLIFLGIVAALTVALIFLFYAMERSVRMMQFRKAVVRHVDRQFGQGNRDHR